MKNFKYRGDIVDLTVPAGGAVSGEGYVIGDLVVIATMNGDAGDCIPFNAEGVVEVALNAALAVNEGDNVDWDDTAKEVVAGGAGDKHMGHALQTLGAAAGQTVRVKLSRATS